MPKMRIVDLHFTCCESTQSASGFWNMYFMQMIVFLTLILHPSLILLTLEDSNQFKAVIMI